MLQHFFSLLQQTISTVYTKVVLGPLRRLYFYGPRFYGHGFWRGATAADICAALTNHDSQFWLQHPQACADIIEKDFHSIVVLAETVGYFVALYLIVKVSLKYCSRRRSQRAVL